MKKKTIEKIPYLKLPSVICKKDVKYVGVTAVKVIGHEKHLFLEVYQNKEDINGNSAGPDRGHEKGFWYIFSKG